MQKVIGAINMTLNGILDHDAVDVDMELHDYYAQVINNANIILYGRITYHLMEFWKELKDNPSGNIAYDNFALHMDKIHKRVFSTTLSQTNWDTASLASQNLEAEIKELKIQYEGPILVGSRSLVLQLIKENLLDELQICIHPYICGNGQLVFNNLNPQDKIKLDLKHTKILKSGAVILTYSFI